MTINVLKWVEGKIINFMYYLQLDFNNTIMQIRADQLCYMPNRDDTYK